MGRGNQQCCSCTKIGECFKFLEKYKDDSNTCQDYEPFKMGQIPSPTDGPIICLVFLVVLLAITCTPLLEMILELFGIE